MEEPGRLQSMGLLRVGHDWVTSLSVFTFMHWRRKWQPTQCSCLENSRDGGAWWAAVYGITQSRTRLKWLSSSSSPHSQRVWNAVLGCNLKTDRLKSVRFQSKPFSITVIQVYAPNTNAKEAEDEWFYDDLQDLLELTPKKISFSS